MGSASRGVVSHTKRTKSGVELAKKICSICPAIQAYPRVSARLCVELSPADWVVPFFAEAAFGELPGAWFDRLAFKESPLQKRICEAPDRTGNCACCSASTRVAKNRTTSTACSRAHHRTRCRSLDRIFFVARPTVGSCFSVSDTFADVLLGHARSNTREMLVGREHRLLRCAGGDREQRRSKCRNSRSGLHDYRILSPRLFGSSEVRWFSKSFRHAHGHPPLLV